MSDMPPDGDASPAADLESEPPRAQSDVGANLAAAIVQGVDARAAYTDEDIATGKLAAELKSTLDDIDLRKRYAKWLLITMGLELAAVNGIFIWYGSAKNWDIPPRVIDLFLGATILQVFGVIAVITRYLFPLRERRGNRPQT